MTRRTAGRTTVFAGSTLLLSMLVAFFIVPGSLLASLAATVAMVVALSVLVATVAAPAVLVLLGANLDRWRIGAAAERALAADDRGPRRPAAPGAGRGRDRRGRAPPRRPRGRAEDGPAQPDAAAHDAPARQDFELIARSVGAGFESPFVVVAATDHGAITDPARLAALARWQRRIAALPGVQAVVGPAQVSRAVAPLRKTGSALLASGGEAGPLAGLGRLGRSLARAASGVAQLREGLSQASSGAGLLAEGSGRAGAGALAISRGLATAGAGSQRAVDALETFAAGSRKLASAQSRAALGALLLKLNLPNVAFNLRHNALRRSRKTQKSLNEDAKATLPKLMAPAQHGGRTARGRPPAAAGDDRGPVRRPLRAGARSRAAGLGGGQRRRPGQRPALRPRIRRPSTELTELQKRLLTDFEETKQVTAFLVSEITNLKKLDAVAKRLSEGLEQIKAGRQQARPRLGAPRARGRIAAGRHRAPGHRLRGAGRRHLPAHRRRHGAGGKPRCGFHRSAPLQSGLRRASVRVIVGNARLQRRLTRVRRATPGLFDSGYFVLSALDGASPRLRERAAEAVDLENGGQAATLLVISRYALNSPGSIALNKRLNADAAALGREAGVTAGVGGGPATLNDYSRVSRARIPYLVAAITLATFLVLVLVLRALPLAAIAVGLNLATVGVAFGILTLLFNVPESWPLGGHTYVDAVGTMMIFGVVFGLSIDYAVFLLVRMRSATTATATTPPRSSSAWRRPRG